MATVVLVTMAGGAFASTPPSPLCVPSQNLLDSPEAIAAAGFLPAATPASGEDIEPCPATFSNCQDVPGKTCRLRNPVTTDTNLTKCQLQEGNILECPGDQTIHKTTKSCVQMLVMICCVDESCEFACGTCEGGSQSISCQ
jgi:hypothetical protein